MVLTHFSMDSLQTNYIALFYTICLTYLSLKVYQKSKKRTQSIEIDDKFPIRQSETPKEKDSGLVRVLGTSAHGRGVTKLGTL
jgi:hypothetical protein